MIEKIESVSAKCMYAEYASAAQSPFEKQHKSAIRFACSDYSQFSSSTLWVGTLLKSVDI